MTELLKQAALLLAREATRLPSHSFDALHCVEAGPASASRPIPVRPGVSSSMPPAAHERPPSAGAMVPSGNGDADLRRQVYEVIGSLLNLVGERPDKGQPSVASEFVPDALLRRSPRGVSSETRAAAPREDQVPLIHCDAIVAAGGTAHSRLRMLNQSDSPCPATLYCSNFVTDTGYEIPSVRVSMSPRHVVLPARGASDFEIAVAVPDQTPAGCYAGLIRAMGSRDFQVVLSVEVS